MNKVLLFLLILSVSCSKSRDGKTTEKVGNDVKTDIANQLDGYWLSDSYLNNVESSRSIYESRNYQSKFWGFRLEKGNLLSGSPTINGFTEHEGGYGGSLKFDSTKSVFSNDLSNPSESSFLDKPFELKLVNPDHLELNFGSKKDIYRRVSDEQVELRRILFEGRFRDLMHDNSVIEFSGDGQIKGLDSQGYFELVFDFGEGINYDASVFYPNKDSAGLWTNGDLFQFKIKGDTIKLYKITPDWNEMNHQIGDLEYLLVKL